eukprot:maker-scaffold_6-snap-gene-13.0-mRNA-1 protein AED:0.00 eAED:0.00 QI:213/1/1/1/1/1/2/1365/245
MQSPSRSFRFLSAWFCPYAQRAWIALEHLQIPHTYVEALHLQEDETYKKDVELLKYNKKGLVPTLVDKETYESITDSLNCVNALSTLSNSNLSSPSLLKRAEQLNENICSKFYIILVRQEEEKQKQAFKELMKELESFSNEASASSGHFWGASLSIVDIALFPWAFRFFLLKTYRGDEYDVLKLAEEKQMQGFLLWFEEMLKLDCVQKTLAEKDKLVWSYKRYAKGYAQSQVGEAVRKGLEAHTV